jgi:hypothetical protein
VKAVGRHLPALRLSPSSLKLRTYRQSMFAYLCTG